MHKVIALLKANLAKIPNVLTNPAPDVEILTFTLAGPVLAVRPYCNNKDYWQVYFDTNRTIRDTGARRWSAGSRTALRGSDFGCCELTVNVYLQKGRSSGRSLFCQLTRTSAGFRSYFVQPDPMN